MKILRDVEFGRDYKPGYVFFSFKTDSIVSDGIAMFTSADRRTGIKVSHCGLIGMRGQAIEADETEGIVATNNFESKYLRDPNRVVFFREPIDLNKRKALLLVSEAMSHIGRKYSYLGVAGSALGVILTKGWKLAPCLRRAPNPFNSKYEFFCSELVAAGLRNKDVLGKTGCLKFHPTNIYPQTLFDDDGLWTPWSDEFIRRQEECGRSVVEETIVASA